MNKNTKELLNAFAQEEGYTTSLSNVMNMDFEKVYEKAIEIFADQALLDKDSKDITIKDLAIAKTKSSEFLSAINGIIEIGHQVEVLSAEKNKFRRKDELDILNSLRRSCAKASKTLEDSMDLVVDKLNMLQKNLEDADPEQISLLQSVLRMNIDTGQKIIGSVSRLIQLERLSGSRPWGRNSISSNASINYIEHLDSEEGAGGANKNTGKVKEISLKELSGYE